MAIDLSLKSPKDASIFVLDAAKVYEISERFSNLIPKTAMAFHVVDTVLDLSNRSLTFNSQYGENDDVCKDDTQTTPDTSNDLGVEVVATIEALNLSGVILFEFCHIRNPGCSVHTLLSQ